MRMTRQAIEKPQSGPLIPVRERKKAAQRSLFLRVALSLFARRGFDRVRLEDVAAASSVSVATLYNYFRSKRDLLIALLIKDRIDGLDAYEKALRDSHLSPSVGVANLLHANIDIIQTAADKRLWREILGAVATSHDRERDGFARNHDTFKAYIRRLLNHYLAAGALPHGIQISLATDIIFGINEHNLRHLVSCSACTPEDMREVTRQQASVLFGESEGHPAGRLRRACRRKPQPNVRSLSLGQG